MPKYKQFSEYEGSNIGQQRTAPGSREVVSDLKVYGEIDFLESHLENKTVPECIQRFFESSSPIVRKLAFTIFNQNFLKAGKDGPLGKYNLYLGNPNSIFTNDDITQGVCINSKTSQRGLNSLNSADIESIIQQMIHDPFYKVRLLSIAHIKDLGILLKLLKDQNTDIKLAILKRIGELEQDQLSEKLLGSLCHLINDRDVSVRKEFSRVLSKFHSSDESFCSRLFDKNDIGLFVYGAEDEIDVVRKNIIKAVGNFPIPTGIDYLIDMLNEESEDIRVAILVALRACTRMQNINKLSINKSQAKYILNMIEESNAIMQRNILKIISRIKYVDTEIFFDLYGRNNVEDRYKFPCLIAIVKNNPDIFSEYLHLKFSPAIDHQLQLSDSKYVGNLLIAFSLRRDIASCCRRLKEDFKFIKLKIFSGKKNINPSKLYRDLEECGMVKHGKLEMDISKEIDHFCSIKSNLTFNSNDSEELFRIIFRIYRSRCNAKNYGIKYAGVPGNFDHKRMKIASSSTSETTKSLNSDSSSDFFGIFRYRFSIPQSLADYTRISKIDYILSTPGIVYRNPNCYVCFRAAMAISKPLEQGQMKNIKLAVTDSTNIIYFDFATSANISILTNCTSIVCFMALISDLGIFDLTPRKTVAIEAITYS